MGKCAFIAGGVAALVLGGAAGIAQAVIIDELPGNMFKQTGAPANGNVSISFNIPQNRGGGDNPDTVGLSNALDGDVANSFTLGTFGSGGMANIGLVRGAYTDGTLQQFNTSPFAAIGQIRVWIADYTNDDSSKWQSYPNQVKVAYRTTANFNPENAYQYNSNTLGVLPGGWSTDAVITQVNGTAVGTMTYGSGSGWTDLTGKFITTNASESNSHVTRGYVDLTLNIPAGATSVMISFGEINTSTGNQGGLVIRDIQAAPVPEPASLGLISIGGLALLRRRAR